MLLRAAKLSAAATLLLRVGGLDSGLVPPAWLSLAALILLLAYERVDDAFAARGREVVVGEWRTWVQDHWFELCLAVVALAGLWLRMFDIAGDLGHVTLNTDESRLNLSVLHLLRTGDIDYQTVEHYPGVHYWMLVGTYVLSYVWGLMSSVAPSFERIPADFFVAFGRSVSAFENTATVLLTGLLGRRLAGQRAGLLAAGALALAPLSMLVGRQLRNDAAQTLLIVAAVFMAFRMLGRDHEGYEAVLAGGFAGLAAGIKYTGVLVMFPVLLAAATTEAPGRRWRTLGLVLGGFLVAALLSNHFVWADLPNFVEQMSDQMAFTQEGHWATQANPAAYHMRILAGRVVGWPLLLLAAAAAAWYLAQGNRRWWLFVSFPLIYVSFVGQRPAQLPRWVYPSAPFVAVAAGVGLVAVVDFARHRFADAERRPLLHRLIAPAMVVILAWPILSTAAVSTSRMLSPATWTLAERWIEANAALGDRILARPGQLYFDPQRYAVSRYAFLDAIVEAGFYELASYDWIVVDEDLRRHDALERLEIAHTVTVDPTLFGNRGPDFSFFKPPPARPAQIPLEVDFADRASREFLERAWLINSSRTERGRQLAGEGGTLFLPPLGRGDLRLALFVEPFGADNEAGALEVLCAGQLLEAEESGPDAEGRRTYVFDLPISIVGPGVVTLNLRPTAGDGSLRIGGFRLYAAEDEPGH